MTLLLWRSFVDDGGGLPPPEVIPPDPPPDTPPPGDDNDAVTTATEQIRWLRRAAGVNNEQTRTRHSAAQLAMETGVGLSSGLGSDPLVMLRWSDNGGHTWSNTHTAPMGAQGQFKARALWRRLGQGRNRVYEVSGTDPVKVAILDFYIAGEAERRG